MTNDIEQHQPGSEPMRAGEPQSSSLVLALQQFKKEDEKKEAAAEAAKTRCKTCFKEVAPQRRCSGHGGGGGGGSGKTSEEKASPGDGQLLTQPAKVETIYELIDEFAVMEDGEAFDYETNFDPEVIAELIAKGQLLVDNDRESMMLTIKLLCEPKELTEEQREELKKYMTAIIKEFKEFKEENKLPHDCLQILQDKEGNIRSLRITMPTLALYDAFIQRLANNLAPTVQEKDELTEDKKPAPNPLSMVPKPAHSTEEEDEERYEVSKAEEEQKIFNPSPFKMTPWEKA